MKRYDNDSVFRIHVSEPSQLELLESFQDSPQFYSFWTSHNPVDLQVNNEKVSETRKLLTENNVKFEVLIENVQQLLDKEQEELLRRDSKRKGYDFLEHYNTYEENIDWLKGMSKTYSNMSKLVTIGKSYEGRKIVAIKIFSPNKGANPEKRSIWFDATIHAREWIAPATANFILSHFLTEYDRDSDVRDILEDTDLYFLPIFNPDGYVYSWEADRFWRKTRSPNPQTPGCVGTDANRNWPKGWGDTHGASSDPCATSYYGSAPFSEVEVKQVAEFLSNLTRLIGYLNVHSYSQRWMYPWGYSPDLAPDQKEMDKCAKRSVKALTKVNGTPYIYGQVSVVLYPATGSSIDWVYDELGVVHAYGIELRDTGWYGFLLPENQIIPTANETLAGFKEYARYVIDKDKDM